MLQREHYLIIQPKWATKEINVAFAQQNVSVTQHLLVSSTDVCVHPACMRSSVLLRDYRCRWVHAQQVVDLGITTCSELAHMQMAQSQQQQLFPTLVKRRHGGSGTD